MEPIRILHVLYGMNFAGTETLLMNLYRNIDRSKVQFDFAVCANSPCDYDEEIKSLGGKLIRYPRYKGVNHIEYVRWWHTFFSEDKEHKIVHGHIGSTAAIYLAAAKKYGRYTIAHSHATNSNRLNAKALLYKLYAYPTRYIADYYFGCSAKAIEDRFGKRIANDKLKAKVFYNAIDADRFAFNKTERMNVRREFGIDEKELVLGTVGRLTQVKNPYMILEILYRLKKSGISFKFMWFGRGELEEQINKQIAELGLEKIVIMGGVRKDINRMLQAMDIFIFPSLREGLGITCVEAQAADLMCFCSNTIPIEARITEKYKALPIDDTDKWVSAICTYLESEKKNRYDRSCDIKNAGYDITTQAKWIEEFYNKKFAITNSIT